MSVLWIILAAVVSYFIGFFVNNKIREIRLKREQEQAHKILENAKKEAEKYKESARLEVRAEWSKKRTEFESEIRTRRRELERKEKQMEEREKNLERKADLVAKREIDLKKMEKTVRIKDEASRVKEEKLNRLLKEENEKLEKISGITSEEAKKELFSNLEEEARHEARQRIREIKEKAEREAEKEAKSIITMAMQKCVTEHVVESAVSAVPLPNDDMKGRLIGREGRNIRAFENAAGVDLVIDDTPEAVTISSFDPVQREIARGALEKLISDGRIHPARIEEVVEKARIETKEAIKAAGEEATLDLGTSGLHSELIRLLGTLKFRTSYGQNVLQHSKEVARLAGLIADELEFDAQIAKRAGLLHDIGKATSGEIGGTHQKIGAELARKYGESDIVVNAIEAHHRDIEPTSPISVIVEVADAISGARPGARRESFEIYIERLQKLENIANSFDGVEKSYAVQAGREIRIIVEPEKISDNDIKDMAESIAKRIEGELKYPGEIKVTVLRETRAFGYAK